MKLTKEEKFFLKKRTEKKIEDIESYVDSLNSFRPETFEEYKTNIEKKLACERSCEKIAEALVDLAIFLIRYMEIGYNDEDEKAYGVLLKKKVISESLFGRLHDLKGMRDHIAHRYGEIDDGKVFHAISEEIEKDTYEFLEIVKKNIEEVKNGN